MADTTLKLEESPELQAAHRDLVAAESALASDIHASEGGARTRLTAHFEDYVRANRRYIEILVLAMSSGAAGGGMQENPEFQAFGRYVRDLWSDKQRVVASTANFVGKSKDFQQVHNALLKHIDQSWRCFQSLYVLMGGDVADLHRK